MARGTGCYAMAPSDYTAADVRPFESSAWSRDGSRGFMVITDRLWEDSVRLMLSSSRRLGLFGRRGDGD